MNDTEVSVADSARAVSDRDRDLMERRRRVLGPAYRLFYDKPVHFVRGEGVWLYDADGNAFLDVYNNVASVGHCHPHVVEALSRQAAVLNTHTRYLSDGVLDYAERLTAKLPREVSQMMFTCTGSEANDLALRIAREHTGGDGFIVTQNAYHGVTQAVAELSPSLGAAVKLGAHVRTVPAPLHQGDVAATFAAGVRVALDEFEAAGVRPAAFLVDTVFSSDGVFTDPPGFLAQAVDVARKAGALFIADEVQAGFGRTGDHFWGFERHGVIPDMVTMGKPMGAGHPMAGVAVRPDVLDAFGRASRYFNTFGGNPVSCAVGEAVLDVIEHEHLMENAARVGAVLKSRLEALAQAHDVIGEVRGAGLFIGVDVRPCAKRSLSGAQLALHIVNGLRERRVLISATGPDANVLKIRPPLTFSEENVELFMNALTEVLAAL